MIWSLVREDLRTNSNAGLVCKANFILYRFGNRLLVKQRSSPRASLPSRLPRALVGALYRVMQGMSGSCVPFSASIGRRLRLPHGFSGIFLSSRAVIGDDVTILHQVTIGSKIGSRDSISAPCVGNGVLIGAGAKIIGAISIGNGARVGVNAVVVDDVPSKATVAAPAAQLICSHVE